MPATDPKLIAALLTAKAALDGALLALTEQAPPASPPAEPVPAPAGAECTHPKEYREDQRSFGVIEAWKCKVCGFEYRR